MKQGWEIKTLGDISEIMNGGTPDTTVPKFWDGENLWITPKDMGKLESIYVDDTLRKITDEGLKNSSAKILPPNSIILSSRAPIGHLAINTKTISTNQGCKGLVPKIGVDTLFLYYFLSKSVDLLNSLGTGATFKELSGSKLGTVEIPLPPLPEQQRIVSILDEAFAAIAKAKANAEQNLKNVKELFESYLQGVFENKGEGWEEKTLGEVLVKTETVDPTKKPNEEFIYLDVSSVNKETKEIENATVLLGKDAPSRARKLVRTNDVIFATVRPTHSRVALITEEYDEQVCSTGYFVLRAKEFLNNNLIYYFVLTYSFNKQMEKLQKGASYPAVTDSEVKGIYIPFPKSLKEQQTIVQKLNALSAETKKLEAIYQQKINDLEELKKSVLQKAFSGELVIKNETV
jgi:type I restriction enzyme S subunit